MEHRFEEPGSLEGEEVAVPYRPEEYERSLSGIVAAVRSHEGRLLSIDGVEGVAAGADAVVVYTRERSVAERLPDAIDGYPVEIAVTGKIKAL